MELKVVTEQIVVIEESEIISAFMQLYKKYRGVDGFYNVLGEWFKYPEVEQFTDEDHIVMSVLNNMTEKALKSEA